MCVGVCHAYCRCLLRCQLAGQELLLVNLTPLQMLLYLENPNWSWLPMEEGSECGTLVMCMMRSAEHLGLSWVHEAAL